MATLTPKFCTTIIQVPKHRSSANYKQAYVLQKNLTYDIMTMFITLSNHNFTPQLLVSTYQKTYTTPAAEIRSTTIITDAQYSSRLHQNQRTFTICHVFQFYGDEGTYSDNMLGHD